MNKHLLISLLLIPFAVSAQSMGGTPMTEAQMQQMMQQAQSMQNCMANIDQTEMEAFQQKAEAMDAEVKALCAAGNRDAAMARAMAFGKETTQSRIMQDMKKCGEGMQGIMQRLPKTAHPYKEESKKTRHICDQ